MEEFKKKLKEIGNPYNLLELDEKQSHNKKEIKAAYKAMALKYHPDKNSGDDAQERFHKIQLAYKILSNPVEIKMLEEYKLIHVDQQKRVDEMTNTQRKFYDDLKSREAQFKEQEEERKKQEMRDYIKKQQKQEESIKQAQEEEKQRELKRQHKIQFELENQTFHTKINSIKVKWSKKQKVSFNEKILNMQFRQYGPLKDITIIDSKRTAIIEFMTAAAAENAVKDNRLNSNSDSDSDNQDLTIRNPLKVKFLLKEEERIQMIKMIEIKQKEQNKSKDLTLSSNNLNKIADILSRGASNNQRKNIINSSVSELKRQHERKKIMETNLPSLND